jgi:hypothetical protein
MNPTIAKCKCNQCSAYIEFDAGDAGQTVPCPHCGMDTILYIPQLTEAKPARPGGIMSVLKTPLVPIAPLPQPQAPPEKPKEEDWTASSFTLMFFSWIFIISGIVTEIKAETIHQQIYGAVSSAVGILLVALSLILKTLQEIARKLKS